MQQLAAFRHLAKKIVCVGRNYREHAKELGNAIPTTPMLFVKTTNAFVEEHEKVFIPPGCQNLHQEVELGIIFNGIAKNVPKSDALSKVGGYCVALDMTARDFQDDAKKAGAPWFLAKSFDTSCPVSKFIPLEQVLDPHNVEIYCKINGVDKQRCNTNMMIFDIPTLIEYASKFVTFEAGDVLLTGTPAGVCHVDSGDVIEFGLKDISKTTINVV